MFLFIGCLMAVVQGGYVRRIKPGNEKKTVLRGLLIIVPSFAAIGFAQTKVSFVSVSDSGANLVKLFWSRVAFLL